MSPFYPSRVEAPVVIGLSGRAGYKRGVFKFNILTTVDRKLTY